MVVAAMNACHTLGALSNKDGPDSSAACKLLPGHIPHPLDTLPMGVLPSRGFLLDQGNPEHAPQQPQAAVYHKQPLPVVAGYDSRG